MIDLVRRSPTASLLLRHSGLVLLLLVYAALAVASETFREPGHLLQILVQTSSLAVVATGMTFVLITAGIDLSVGAVLFLAAAIFARLVAAVEGFPLAGGLALMLAVGLTWGALQGWLVTRLRLVPFVLTLATLFVGRGLGLAITQTHTLSLPAEARSLATATLGGIPWPVILALGTVLTGQAILSRTPLGRFLFAIGENPEKARRAGLPVRNCVLVAYAICGFCACLGGWISLGELGAVSPNFGEGEEFHAVAAAVLGGTSLFGGRGSVLPGTLVGALLIQTIQSGLNVLNFDPYLYPVVTSVTIFIAVWIDGLQSRSES